MYRPRPGQANTVSVSTAPPTGHARRTLKLSFASSAVSPLTETLIRASVAPAGMVSWPDWPTKSPEAAVAVPSLVT